jgi:4-amino-4-deoxy-L-arabinose transferase-like glycosyltransferase
LSTLAVLVAALLTAVSPAMVFYSRYYIQEMLLASFTLAALWTLWQAVTSGYAAASDGNPPPAANTSARGGYRKWLVSLGVSLGLMYASKETCILAISAMVVAAAVAKPGLRHLALSVPGSPSEGTRSHPAVGG